MTNLASKALKLAHKLKAQFKTWSKALKAAWKIVKVRIGKIEQAIVTFKKKNGTITTRRVQAITEKNYTFKGGEQYYKPTLFKFVDLDKYESGEKFYIISFHINQLVAAF